MSGNVELEVSQSRLTTRGAYAALYLMVRPCWAELRREPARGCLRLSAPGQLRRIHQAQASAEHDWLRRHAVYQTWRRCHRTPAASHHKHTATVVIVLRRNLRTSKELELHFLNVIKLDSKDELSKNRRANKLDLFSQKNDLNV